MPSPRRTRASPKRSPRRTRKTSPKRRGKLVKGSKEAKEHMARLRAMRKVHRHKLTRRKSGERKTVAKTSPRRTRRGTRKASPKRARKASPKRTKK